MIDPLIILIALTGGVAVRKMGYPPMLGYLMAGFVLNELPIEPGQLIQGIADAGVTLLLFTIGLKLNLRELASPSVWAVALLHMALNVLFLAGVGYLALSVAGLADGMSLPAVIVIAFALSFSSTVFAVKIFEQRGENAARPARIAIGILIVQDLAAVIFLAANTGKTPEISAIMLATMALLFVGRKPLAHLLRWCGHGELLILFGMGAAFGGAALFETFNIKGDLGALIVGVLLAGNTKSTELATTLLDLKDLFLVGFFVTIGINGDPQLGQIVTAGALALLVAVKPVIFFPLMTVFRLRARTALVASLALSNYSEFGLIVASLAAAQGLISADWVIIIALALSFSFLLAVPFNDRTHTLYQRFGSSLRRLQRKTLLIHESPPDFADTRILMLGMGRVGLGAYQFLRGRYGNTVTGVEEDRARVRYLLDSGVSVVPGDANDEDFWAQVDLDDIDLIMINLSKHSENKTVCKLLKELGYTGSLAAIARYPDQREELANLGCISFNLYQEAGFGFAEHVCQRMGAKLTPTATT